MSIPAFNVTMLPLLKCLADEQPHFTKELVSFTEQQFKLTDKEKIKRMPNGTKTVIYDRVTWALTYLKKAGLISSIGRGTYQITDSGKKLLSDNPTEITVKLLKTIPQFAETLNTNTTDDIAEPVSQTLDGRAPEEIIGSLTKELEDQLALDLLDLIYNNDPDFFERLVVDLLLKMGYGGFENSGTVTQRTGDGGIDGIIKQDKLGLDAIYLQAKRWKKDVQVSSPEMDKFIGAVQKHGGGKGVFITTSTFSKHACESAEKAKPMKIVTIDGVELTKLMIEHGLGVSVSKSYEIKQIDNDYFEQ
jgi:restriction system protein